jgi:DNA-binding PucR family transcriptional regulator
LKSGSSEQAGAVESASTFAAGLSEHRSELRESVSSRTLTLLRPEERAHQEYVVGVRLATAAAVDYAFSVLEAPRGAYLSTPPELLRQARLAASLNIGLESVLRRYSAGFHTFADAVLSYGASDPQRRLPQIHRALRVQAAHFSHLIHDVSEEHKREAATRLALPQEERAKKIRALLDGELIDLSTFPHPMECWHIGIIQSRPTSTNIVRDIAAGLGQSILIAPGHEQTTWMWLSGKELSAPEVHLALGESRPQSKRTAVGEPGFGLAGWRLTHRQARATYAVMQGAISSYSEQALLASIAQDDLLSTSLKKMYLTPLEAEKDGGRKLRETLRAYLEARGQVSSAAATLRVSRKTVSNRLARIEEHLQRPITSCSAELDAALRLEALDAPTGSQTG